MDPVTIALLIKLLGPAALQIGGAVITNVHQDVLGYQQVLISQNMVQVAYYNSLTAYYQTQRHRIRYKCPPKKHK